MEQLGPDVWGCRDDDAIKRKLKALGRYDEMMECIRNSPGKDLMLMCHEADGSHAFVWHNNPKGQGFTHYHTHNPAMLLPLLVWFNAQCGSGAAQEIAH